ncbi:hypothetical protein LOTGIDRAFT_80390, partial [Lottia gigantea]
TPLHHVSRLGHVDCADLLIEHGAQVNSSDFRQKTPLHHAADNNQTDIANTLIRHGADVKVQDEDGLNP